MMHLICSAMIVRATFRRTAGGGASSIPAADHQGAVLASDYTLLCQRL